MSQFYATDGGGLQDMVDDEMSLDRTDDHVDQQANNTNHHQQQQQQQQQQQPAVNFLPRNSFFPGFLAADDQDMDQDLPGTTSAPSTPSSPSSSPSTTLPIIKPSPSRAFNHPVLNHVPQFSPSTSGTGNQASPLASSSNLSPFPFGSRTTSPGRISPSPSPRRRPSPLDLKGKSVGVDEEYEIQRDDEAKSAGSDGRSTFSHELQDLSILRQSVKQNLIARPIDSPFPTTSESGSSGLESPASFVYSLPDDDMKSISFDQVLNLPTQQTLILDTRPLTSFLESHFPRSANIAIPSLILKRFRKQGAKWSGGWDGLGGFVSEGKSSWEAVDPKRHLDVVIVGTAAVDEMAIAMRRIMISLVDDGDVRILQGGWDSVDQHDLPHGSEMAFEETGLSTSLPPPKSAPISSHLSPPILDSNNPSTTKVAHHPSMPQLRKPTLTIPNSTSIRRTPKLSLNLDKPTRSATLGSFPSQADAAYLPSPDGVKKKSSMLTIDIGDNRKTPLRTSTPSFQTMCHQQSKLPPSPSSFGDVKRLRSPDATAKYDAESSGNRTARGGSGPFIVSTILPSFLYLGPEITSAREVVELQRLGVKRILNVALECDDDEGLGLREKFERYHRVPMRDIVEESGVAKGMRESCEFLDDARLHSAPTYVHCRAGKSRSVTVVLAYLIHANAWSLKTAYAYVAERRKGISPNIGFVAELMQFEEAELGLKQSGGVHADTNGAPGSSSKNGNGEDGKEEGDSETRGRSNSRYMRESLPPAWATTSLDSSRPARIPLGHGADGHSDDPHDEEESRRQGGEEKEIRKNGQWVHSRRIPVDRTTLQPGRRVSKAGLESLRPLDPVGGHSSADSPNSMSGMSPVHRTERKEHASTPGGDGRVGWV